MKTIVGLSSGQSNLCWWSWLVVPRLRPRRRHRRLALDLDWRRFLFCLRLSTRRTKEVLFRWENIRVYRWKKRSWTVCLCHLVCLRSSTEVKSGTNAGRISRSTDVLCRPTDGRVCRWRWPSSCWFRWLSEDARKESLGSKEENSSLSTRLRRFRLIRWTSISKERRRSMDFPRESQEYWRRRPDSRKDNRTKWNIDWRSRSKLWIGV